HGERNDHRAYSFLDYIAPATSGGKAEVGYEVINLGSHTPVELIDAARLTEETSGKSADIHFEPRHKADVTATWANISKAERLLGWRPQYDFRKGVKALVDWYEANRDWAREIET